MIIQTPGVWLVCEGLGHVRAQENAADHVIQLKRSHNGVSAGINELDSEFSRINSFVLLGPSAILTSDFDRVDTRPCKVVGSHGESVSGGNEHRIHLTLCRDIVSLEVTVDIDDRVREAITVVTPLSVHGCDVERVVSILIAVEL